MRFKEGIRIFGARPELVLALQVASDVYRGLGYDMVVTSITDGAHSPSSLHYAGCAADVRTSDISEAYAPDWIASKIRECLGNNPDVDVVVEKTHIHIEFQPKLRKG